MTSPCEPCAEWQELQRTSMKWEQAQLCNIDVESFYLVQTNGGEWRDHDLMVMKGYLVAHRLNPDYVRGHPEWICKIIRPEGTP